MSEQCPDILRCDPQDLRQAMSICLCVIKK